jgi:putative flippase GtrA
MRQAAVRVWRYGHTPEGLKLIKYTTVSAISALTSIVVLAIVYGVLRLWTEVPSVLFSDIVAGIPSYFLNRQWVWGKSGRSHWWREVLPFWVVSLTGIGFALVTASLARNFAQTHDLPHLARTVLVVGANVGAFAIVWLLKFMILNRLFRQFADREIGPETEPETEPETGPETEPEKPSTPASDLVGESRLNQPR